MDTHLGYKKINLKGFHHLYTKINPLREVLSRASRETKAKGSLFELSSVILMNEYAALHHIKSFPQSCKFQFYQKNKAKSPSSTDSHQ